jgi:hypothetical protein
MVEIDGMDQHKTNIPGFADESKSVSNAERMKHHVLGVLVNGKSFHVLWHHDHWAHDANLTLAAVGYAFTYLRHGMPSDTLFFQFDNCSRENKNMTVFGYFCLLVFHGFVKNVRALSRVVLFECQTCFLCFVLQLGDLVFVVCALTCELCFPHRSWLGFFRSATRTRPLTGCFGGLLPC